MPTDAVRTLGPQLAGMDRRLHDIQTELVPEREPRPLLVTAAIPDPAAAAPAPPPPIPDPVLDRQTRALTELSERLIASMRELLDGYERVLAPRALARPAPARPALALAPVALTAGPFASIEALREFEEALSHLRGVREVTVRGYEGPDRAIIDVRLA